MIGVEQRCAVVGYGSWATAIVKILTENGIKVNWHILNEEILSSVKSEGRNCKYLRDVDLDNSLINASHDINEVVRDTQNVVLAMPSAFMKDVMKPLIEPLHDKLVISAVKGIIPEQYNSLL